MTAALLRRRRTGAGSSFGYRAANGYTPDLVSDFVRGRYAKAVAHSTGYRPQRCEFDELYTHAATELSTMTDATGTLKWNAHNLLDRSEEFDNAAWAVTTATITANASIAPDGTTTADRLTSTGSSAPQVYNSLSGMPQEVTYGIFAKAGTASWISLSTFDTGGARQENYFDLENGVTGTISNDSPSITSVGSDWYYCTVSRSGDPDFFAVNVCSGDGAFAGSGYIDIWGAHLYRSDLGGMAQVPSYARGLSTCATYTPTTSAAVYLPRLDHHKWDGSAWVNKGLLIESEARTNLAPYSEDRSQWVESGLTGAAATTLGNEVQGVSFTPTAGAESYRIYDATNTAWITSLTAFDVAADNAARRQSVTFTTPAGCTSIRVYMSRDTAETAYVYDAIAGLTAATEYTASWFYEKPSSVLRLGGLQLEQASTPSSYKPTSGSTFAGAAETLTIASANLPWQTSETPTGITIHQKGEVTYADTDSTFEVIWYQWEDSANDKVKAFMATHVGGIDYLDGTALFQQADGGTVDSVIGTAGEFDPGVNVPYNIASRHGDTFINGAVDGTALTEDTTPTALPDLTATDMEVAYDFMGTIEAHDMWGVNTGDDGIEESTT